MPKSGEEKNGDDSYDSEEDDGKWMCNGTEFMGGCKSGQQEFGFHEGTEGWQCPDRDCDFDICDMCIRWVLHCEKNSLEIKWKNAQPNPDGAAQQESEPYLTDRGDLPDSPPLSG